MSQLLIRNLEEETIQKLKARAKSHNRSLQGEVKLILEAVARQPDELPLAIAGQWQGYFAGRSFTDSTEQVREDRER